MDYCRAHGYKDGQELNCARCSQVVRVKLHHPGGIVVATPGSLGNRVLICGDCGRIFCQSCMASLGKPLPKCDSCGGNITLPCA